MLQEEVMPNAVSQSSLLAPEEIFRKKKKTSELKGEAEVPRCCVAWLSVHTELCTAVHGVATEMGL